MSAESPMILLVGRGFMPGSAFLERLCRNGYVCAVAHTLDEARAALRATQFDVVLSEMGLPDETAFPLIGLLEGTPATLFFCVGVHDGCWWLPALARGRRTWGQAALRPAEFARALAELLGTDALRAAESVPNVIPMPAPPAVGPAKPVRSTGEDNRQAKKSSL